MSDQAPSTAAAEPPLHEQEAARLEKRDRVRDELGLDPYGHREGGLVSLAEARATYDEEADEAHQASVQARKAHLKAHPEDESGAPAIDDRRPRVKIAGRAMLVRDGGKLVWMNLRDGETESFQIAVSKADCSEAGFAVAKATDLGDIVVAEGPLMRTRKGEITLWASDIRPGSKCVTPPPAKHEGLQDTERRYRQRYVDLWANPETMRVFTARSAIVTAIRSELIAMGFLEVETPMLLSMAGGAAARPFHTHLNALGIDLSLRIAPELYLKRLLVGGMPRVFEINRNFRNEGVDRSHNPEFTMLELYEAFGDVESVMAISERLLRVAARATIEANGDAAQTGETAGADGSLKLPFGDGVIDYAPAFDRVRYAELFEQVLGFPTTDHAKAIEAAAKHHIKTKNERGDAIDPVFIVNELFEAVCEPTIDIHRPTWIRGYPAALSPLTRPSREDPAIADRADLFIGGMEIGPHYTELNDPDVQAAKFREQLTGIDDEEQTFRSFDEDFIRALKSGMPPAGGMGLGIDRIAMLMTDQRSIRDVVLFPFMRPEQGRGEGEG